MHLHDSARTYLHLFNQSKSWCGTGQAACSGEGLFWMFFGAWPHGPCLSLRTVCHVRVRVVSFSSSVPWVCPAMLRSADLLTAWLAQKTRVEGLERRKKRKQRLILASVEIALLFFFIPSLSFGNSTDLYSLIAWSLVAIGSIRIIAHKGQTLWDSSRKEVW